MKIIIALAMTILITGKAQSQVTGTYQLAEIGGKALPATIETEDECREDVVSATLTLDTNGTWRMEWVEHEICPNQQPEEERENGKGRYRANGAVLEFLNDAGKSQGESDGDDLDDISTGTVESNTIRVKLGNTDKMLVFRKQ
jgi:hypothetical protein